MPRCAFVRSLRRVSHKDVPVHPPLHFTLDHFLLTSTAHYYIVVSGILATLECSIVHATISLADRRRRLNPSTARIAALGSQLAQLALLLGLSHLYH
jgi:hypothetical protein